MTKFRAVAQSGTIFKFHLRLCAGVLLVCIFLFSSGSATNRLNVMLISIDTLRADRLSCYGYRTKTPAIDSLAAESVLFENAIAQVPLTLPSHSTIFTGQFPPQHGVRNNENFVLPETAQTLAESFRGAGYSTGGVIGSFSLDSHFGISQGFQFYEDKIGTGHDPEINRHVERRAETVWKLSRQWLDQQKGPWFALIHFFDPHFPFNPPAPHPQTYDGEIAYTDKVVAKMLQWLRETKQLDTTIIVLLSDHGESLGEHGEDNHGIFLYDSTLKVPLMVRIPREKPQRIRSQVRLADVAPTIAELAAVKFPSVAGVSLVRFLRGSGPPDLPAYSESYYANLLMGWAPLHSIRWNQKKWIDAPRPEFYDLAKDAGEKRNLYTSSAVPAAIRNEMAKYVRTEPERALNIVDPETQEKLASLGYVTGASSKAISSSFDPKDGIELWVEIEAAVRDAQRSSWSDAEKKFRTVLKKQPDNVIAQKFLANVLRKQKKQDEAIALLQIALKSPLHQTETRNHLAEAFLEKKDYTSALQQFNLVLKQEPSNVRALTMMAWLQSTLNKDQEATQTYHKLSLVRDLTEEEALRAAGIHLTSRKNNEAEKYFRLAIRANEKSPAAWKGLGLIFASRQNWKNAVDALLKAGDCETIRSILPQAKLGSDDLQKVRVQCP